MQQFCQTIKPLYQMVERKLPPSFTRNEIITLCQGHYQEHQPRSLSNWLYYTKATIKFTLLCGESYFLFHWCSIAYEFWELIEYYHYSWYSTSDNIPAYILVKTSFLEASNMLEKTNVLLGTQSYLIVKWWFKIFYNILGEHIRVTSPQYSTWTFHLGLRSVMNLIIK